MNITDWASVIAILVAVTAATTYIHARLSRLDRRIDDLDRRIDDLVASVQVIGGQVRDLLALFGRVIRILHTKNVMSDEEFHDMFATYAEMASKGTEAAIERLSPQANPLTPEEADRLRYYIAKARRGEYFTQAEVEDYNQIVQRMESERPNDPGIWPLLAIGAFLLGLFSGSRKKEEQ